MNWLKELVPMIGTALGGPLGGLAASFVADKLDIKEKTVEAVTNVLNSGRMSPDQIVQVKLAEIEFTKFCQQNGIDLEKIAAADRDSARKMQIETRSNMPALLTTMVTIGFFGELAWLNYDHSLADSAPLMIMLGQLAAAWAACIAFWVGTTSGSQRKTNLLAQADAVK